MRVANTASVVTCSEVGALHISRIVIVAYSAAKFTCDKVTAKHGYSWDTKSNIRIVLSVILLSLFSLLPAIIFIMVV